MNDIAQLSIKILGQRLPTNIEHIYCFAHNIINIPCMINALNLHTHNKNIVILDNRKLMSGVLPSRDISRIYNDHGFKISMVPFNESFTSINTRTESEAVIDWVIQNNIKQLCITAPPYHMLRAFMTLNSVCIEKNINIKIYVINGVVENWNATTITHDGKTITSFENVINMEFKRIQKYTTKGDIQPCNLIWDYIK